MLRACVVVVISAGAAMRNIRLGKGQVSGLLQLLVVVLVIIGALLMSNALKPSGRSAGWQAGGGEARAVTVSLVQPASISQRLTVDLSGVVQNRTSTDVAAQVGGRVVEVASAFRTGGTIESGGLIFQIERREYELALERTLAEIAAAESEIELLETEADLARLYERTLADLAGSGMESVASLALTHAVEIADTLPPGMELQRLRARVADTPPMSRAHARLREAALAVLDRSGRPAS